MDASETRRRLVHASGAVFPAIYLLGLVTWPQLRLVYLAGTALAVALEFLRLVVGLDWWVFRQLTREYERSNPAGYALYTVSSAAVVLAFEPRVAVPAVLMLAIADPVSGLLSRGDRGAGEVKRPLVLAVTFAVCIAIAAAFVPPVPAALGALAATLADGATPVVAGYVIDDNLAIPVGAALAIWAALRWLPALPA